ncbi:hypothetical protein ACFWZ2_20530, partial [Streptomyces sp. NPDC059002]|uniref:hypothetical protein n=1 Tax=Streptomyces sp. NPDC059002 TaxID=3346690 RepID=UPI0036C91780
MTAAGWSAVRFGVPDARAAYAVVLAPVAATGPGPAVVRLEVAPAGGLPWRGVRDDVHLWADPDTPAGACFAECADVLAPVAATGPGPAVVRLE